MFVEPNPYAWRLHKTRQEISYSPVPRWELMVVAGQECFFWSVCWNRPGPVPYGPAACGTAEKETNARSAAWRAFTREFHTASLLVPRQVARTAARLSSAGR